MSALATLQEAAASIPDGALLTFGGFDLNRAPMALVMELIRQRRRALRVVSLPNPLPLDLLVGAGAATEAEFGFLGLQYEGGFVVAPSVRHAIERGRLAWRERDVYEIVQGLRASALGLPFLPAPGAEGSEYRSVNRTPTTPDPEGGEEMLIARALRPDVALVHAQAADGRGNLWISDLYADDLLARASARVVATAERIVDHVEAPTIPGRLVDRVAHVEKGAFPTSCHGHHPLAAPHLAAYLSSASEDRVGDYVERFVIGPGGHPAFLQAAASGPAPAAPRTAPAAAVPGREGRVDRLVVGMARSIGNGEVVTTGLASALPMIAVALAKATHAPRATYINCVGAIDPRITAASFTSVDVRLLDDCEGRVTLPELFDLARQGRIDLMFFGAAQIDPEGRLNLTCIGDYASPKVKLPGPAGSSSMRPFVRKAVLFVPRHSPRTFVPRVDFATSVASARNLATEVVSDLATLRLAGGRLRLVARHAGVSLDEVRKNTGFPLEGDPRATTPEPTAGELEALRRLDPAGIRHRLV